MFKMSANSIHLLMYEGYLSDNFTIFAINLFFIVKAVKVVMLRSKIMKETREIIIKIHETV